MVIAIILILFAVALFLIFHDDHDRSYTRNEPKSGRENGRKSVYQKSAAPRRNAPTLQRPVQTPAQHPVPNPVMGPRTIVPEEKQYRPRKPEEKKTAVDFSYLDEFDYDPNLPERTMSSFIAGLQGYCTKENLGGVIGYVMVDPVTGALEVHDTGDGLMGYLPMKDRAASRLRRRLPPRLPGVGYQTISPGISTREARWVARSPRRARSVDQ